MLKNRDGFSLVELVTGIVLFSIVSISVISLSILIINVQTASRHQETATLSAQKQIETLRNSNYGSLEAGQTIDFTADLPDSLPSGKTGTVQISEPASGLKRVDVTVAYEQLGKTRNITLSSIIGQLGITQ
ncbi:MAG TPA: prepilin-type N-terminal cleavage/methylation domain-containing protein [Patescibacteria group bacterium]|nr:prepilin-type N-terminal cleavage/methylation domain-containing protein [Patescibacteria group bacterium]